MKLTRRDAIGALGAAGITALAGCESLTGGGPGEETASETGTGDTVPSMSSMAALADVLYPSDTEVTEEFLETYLYGRMVDEEAYRSEVEAGIETLDSLAGNAHGSPFAQLSAEQRVGLIENTDLRSGDSVEDGTDVQRVNYHLIDELLFAFYASPTGGELVGNLNPRGFPGGYGYSGDVSG